MRRDSLKKAFSGLRLVNFILSKLYINNAIFNIIIYILRNYSGILGILINEFLSWPDDDEERIKARNTNKRKMDTKFHIQLRYKM